MLPAMFRSEIGHPDMRVQRLQLGSIIFARGFRPRSRSRSPSPRSHRRHHRSPPNRRSSHRSYRSPSPRRFSRICSPSYSPRQHSRYPGRRSVSSVEKYLRDIVENDIGTSSPADSLSNVNRGDLADGPMFSRVLSHPWNLQRGFFREENPSRPFSMRHDKDSYNRDIFIAQLDRSINSEFLQQQSRENKRGEDQESKYFQYDRDYRLFDESIKSRALLAKTEKYYKQSLNKSPSLMYMDEDFHKHERIRRKKEEDLRSRNISTDYLIPDSANQEQSSESRHHYRSEKTPAVPLKSILKKHSDDSSIQSLKPENLEQSIKSENLKQSSVEYDNIHDVLKTIGLDIGMDEIDKLAARTEERLHGKKPAYSPNHHSMANHKAKSSSFLDIPSGPISGSCHDVPYASTFTPTQFFPNSASLPEALPGYDVNQHHMGYATSNWCAQQVDSVYKPEVAKDAKLKKKPKNRNLKFDIIAFRNCKQFEDFSTAPNSDQKSEPKPAKKKARRKRRVGRERARKRSAAAKRRTKQRRATIRNAERKKAAGIGQTSPENKLQVMTALTTAIEPTAAVKKMANADVIPVGRENIVNTV